MPPTSQHEALHRIFLQDEALFARAAAHILGIVVEITEAGLSGTAAQQNWRELMTKQLTPYVSEFRRQGIEEGRAVGIEEGRTVGLEEGLAQGRAKSRAEDILRILDKRGISVDDDSRDQIVSCTDLDTLGAWLDRSLTATQVSDLFA